MRRLAFSIPLALLVPMIAVAEPGAGSFDSVETFARAVGMKAGRWQTRVKVTAAQIKPSPGADPAQIAEVRARIESQVGRTDVRDQCTGAIGADAARLPGILLEPKCSYSRLHASVGRWALSCTLSGREEAGNLISEGTYSRKAVTGRHEGEITHEGVVVHLKAETESRYVGKCRPLKPFDVTEVPD